MNHGMAVRADRAKVFDRVYLALPGYGYSLQVVDVNESFRRFSVSFPERETASEAGRSVVCDALLAGKRITLVDRDGYNLSGSLD